MKSTLSGLIWRYKIVTSSNNNGKIEINLIFQMTGLEVEQCHILELACLITDEQLKPMSDCLNIIIHQTDEILENMSNWCKVQHKKAILSFSSDIFLLV